MNEKILLSLIKEQDHAVRDPLWRDIPLSAPLYELYRSSEMQKLGRIKQLGPAFHLYPGAVHTRLSHSLGVYHLGRAIVINLLREEPAFPFTAEGVQAYLSALLLHDIGHFPYAHSLKDVITVSHEAIGAALIEESGALRSRIEACGTSADLVSAIIDEERPSPSSEISLYRSILSGALDPDKLDYLSRDAFFCGIPYGMQDASYITGKLRIAEGAIAVEETAIASVEHLLFSKYLMYRNVYWHPRTRSATAMVKKAVVALLDDESLREEELFGLDDERFFTLMRQKGDPYALIEAVEENRLYPTVIEVPFDRRLSWPPRERHQREEELCRTFGLKAGSIIIDIPEPISFEATMPIVSDGGTVVEHGQVAHVFGDDIGAAFTKSLRKLRIFSPEVISGTAVIQALELG
ncbi:MAG TPA: HD domain-containing protein [Sphaerochaeta sp.]|jgi:HD superfamily phosphohydrolase|nr:HD domain-containing protein [Spirochaetota bacterium]NLV60917.1 HD domain-containing protein [Spirochaetales bacterium]HOE84037.1 HD domain-containing protein [Sphaerochaeta sp.]HOQ94570.1 HD domain-containing protein [Sphaerochaeta sp.]HPK47235.1 HD domain-containing protein [Sphaerochaeta sp.]